jgi:hypothetical protein
MLREIVQCIPSPLLGPPQGKGQIDRTELSAIADTGEGVSRVGARASQESRPAITGKNGCHQAMMGEHVIDRLVLVFSESLEDNATERPVGVSQQQLGDDLVGTTQVEQLDLGEVEQGSQAVGGGESRFDPSADGGTGRTGDQIAVRRSHGLTEEVSHSNGLDHQASAS